MFTAIDLFAGCGGLTSGLKMSGFDVKAAVEIDDFAAANYSLNHPNTMMINTDICKVQPKFLLTHTNMQQSELDLLVCCPPCQGFSAIRTLNRRRRIIDKRNWLIDEIVRFTEEINPKVLMLENVPQLLSYSRYADFKHKIKKLSYCITDSVVDVANYGIPQRRKRLVFMASRLGDIQIAPHSNIKSNVRQTIGHLENPIKSIDPIHNILEYRSERIKNLIKLIPHNGGSRSSLPKELVLACHTTNDGFYDVYGRMSWDDVAPTITCGCINPSKGRFLHPDQDRAISLREAALLQTFPDDYQFILSKGKYAVAALIGNAIPPLFAKIQAKYIIEHIQKFNN